MATHPVNSNMDNISSLIITQFILFIYFLKCSSQGARAWTVRLVVPDMPPKVTVPRPSGRRG